MDYAVGSVAALISGNVTPNRPRLIRRALTPTKHQQSPNVTPKSECVGDRSIFLSPSLQKKKAIVKKSPKRIFQNPDLDATDDGEGSSVLLSPKADKVKKHLKEDLEADEKNNMSPKSPKSPKKGKSKLDQSSRISQSEFTKKIITEYDDDKNDAEIRNINESTPKKKKKQRNSISIPMVDEKENVIGVGADDKKSSKKKRKSQISTEETNESADKDDSEVTPKKKKRKSETVIEETDDTVNKNNNQVTRKKKKKNKKSKSQDTDNLSTEQTIKLQDNTENQQKPKNKKKKNKKRKNKAKLENNAATVTNTSQNNAATVTNTSQNKNTESSSQQIPKKKKKSLVNPNAITNQDSDSEHESDDEIQSENEQTNNQILDTGPADTSDEEEDVKKPQKQEKKERSRGDIDDEVERTLFVGNVPFSDKCKKEIKRIFRKYGAIETVRIRTVPVKDARVTPKRAVTSKELHPERSTVNVYVRFENASSVNQALAENNTVLNNYHLRVTRSDTKGLEYDPHKAVFVGNLPFAIEDDALRSKFESCGEIESVRIVRDPKTNAGKGFGYINFASKDGVELALAMSEEDLTIKNRIIRVKRCTQTNKKLGTKGNFGNQRNNDRFQGNRSQGVKQRNQGRNSSFGRNQGGGRSQGNFRSQGFGRDQDRSQVQDGAHRRVIMKRRNEESGGPPRKRPNVTQQAREKKPRKEFVGMTAEKKKKHKFNKGDKKKKALSEILTKYS